jgi:hypothetical protein
MVLSLFCLGIRYPRRRCEYLQADWPGAIEAGQDRSSHGSQRPLGVYRQGDVSISNHLIPRT